jgi:hypothetical protein
MPISTLTAALIQENKIIAVVAHSVRVFRPIS